MKLYKAILLSLLFLLLPSYRILGVEQEEKEIILKTVQDIFKYRNEVFITGKVSELSKYFNSGNKKSQWALEHEIKRTRYLRKWAGERGIEFTSVTSTITPRKVNIQENTARVIANEYYKFVYIYKDEEIPVDNQFGVGLIHHLELIKKDGNWVINWDWYTDCFEDALKGISSEIKDEEQAYEPIFTFTKEEREDIEALSDNPSNNRRKKAVSYAHKYCGIPWASNNPDRYNKKYKNYTGAGGNCTNFVSQCIGDKEEGAALKQTGGWHSYTSKYSAAEGSAAWVNADAFKNYLLYSGKGHLLKRGPFKDIIPKGDTGESLFSKLNYGDLICYSKAGDIDHFAIVTGFDSKGYPLINSHTTDRYMVPFDLGWGDKKIGFYLIKLSY